MSLAPAAAVEKLALQFAGAERQHGVAAGEAGRSPESHNTAVLQLDHPGGPFIEKAGLDRADGGVFCFNH